MTINSTSDSASIFRDGKLKPGIYKIQNLYSKTMMDIHEHSRDVCCRPATLLTEGMGLWEIKPLGAGYSIQRVEPGKPDQFCVLLRLVGDEVAYPSLGVTRYPMAWRLVVVDDEEHRGFEYVRLYWETTNMTWHLDNASSGDGTKIILIQDATASHAWQTWKLIPVNVEGTLTPAQLLSDTLGSGSLPPYCDGHPTGQTSTTHVQRDDSERDEFGTMVNEVTVVTTTSTVTTRKRYRVVE